jgi:thioredoxin reductase (NADPH)
MAERFDCIIVGGGPAGLTAALYGARAQMKTLLIEMAVSGGQAATTGIIENYPGFVEGIPGPDLTINMEEQAKRFGAQFVQAEVEKIEVSGDEFAVTAFGERYIGRTLIYAGGAHPRELGVKGEPEFRGAGVSYCATCDGYFFRNKIVAVIGGGDAAVEEGMYLQKLASKVYLIHRRHELRATAVVQERASKSGMEFVWDTVVEEVEGKNAVTGLKLRNLVTGAASQIAVDGVFVYVGYTPNSGLLKGLVGMDEHGYVITGDNMGTNVPGLFAAGDVRQKSLRQVVTAVADGAVAAVSAEKYLAAKVTA